MEDKWRQKAAVGTVEDKWREKGTDRSSGRYVEGEGC